MKYLIPLLFLSSCTLKNEDPQVDSAIKSRPKVTYERARLPEN
jgi:hypothetical protein